MHARTPYKCFLSWTRAQSAALLVVCVCMYICKHIRICTHRYILVCTCIQSCMPGPLTTNSFLGCVRRARRCWWWASYTYMYVCMYYCTSMHTNMHAWTPYDWFFSWTRSQSASCMHMSITVCTCIETCMPKALTFGFFFLDAFTERGAVGGLYVCEHMYTYAYMYDMCCDLFTCIQTCMPEPLTTFYFLWHVHRAPTCMHMRINVCTCIQTCMPEPLTCSFLFVDAFSERGDGRRQDPPSVCVCVYIYK